jgi:Outer membrane lipoprotein carrier protein LolA-like
MRNASHFALPLALLMTLCAAAADNDLDQLMALLAQRTHGHVSFVEEEYLAVLDRPVVASGELLYERPDRLEKRTLAPRRASLILEKGNLTVESGRRKRVLALRDYPQIAPFIESIRATLAGDRGALEQVFQLSFDGSLARWTLSLVPLDAKLQSVVREIRIEGARDELHTVNILQADGDRSVMTIGSTISP